MLAWLILFNYTRNDALVKSLFAINILLVLPGFFAHYKYAIDSAEFIDFWTRHMKYCGAIAPFLLLLWMLSKSRARKNHCLIASVILFITGGVIGTLISGANVTIPAHYHSSIVGISIAFMGICYIALEDKNHSLSKMASVQPYIYAAGQIIHIIGLAWSGGYGVMRKTSVAELTFEAKINMGVMGLGGFIAIIGGLMFVYICVKRIWTPD
jgi:hypothetical protein